MAKGKKQVGNSKGSKKQDYSTAYVVGGLVLCAAYFFSGGNDEPVPVSKNIHISKKPSQEGRLSRRSILGRGSEFYAPWYDDAAAGKEWLDSIDGPSKMSLSNSSELFSACDLENILSEIPTPGFHVLCTLPISKAESSTASTRVAVFKLGMRSASAQMSFLVPKELTDTDDMTPLVNFMSYTLKMKKKKEIYQRMAFFTPRGRRLHEPGSVFKRAKVLVYEGGQWIWPGVKIGHSVELPGLRSKGETTEIVTVSLQPKIFEIKNFLKTSECDHIIKNAGPYVAKSGVSVKDVDKGKAAADGVDQWRTSLTHFYNSRHDKVMVGVEKRVQALTRINISHAEDTQVLRYDLNGRYLSHHDFFDPKDYSGASEQAMIHGGAKNRMATVFFYLNTVPAGGETGFPRAGGLPQPSTFDRCDIGYQSKPEKSKVIIFYSMHPDGSMDFDSLHGGCPVKEGEKWSANFWLWNKAYPVGPQRDGPGKTKVSHLDPLEYEDPALDPETPQVIS